MKKILGILILFFTLSLNFSFADNSQNFLEVNKYDKKIVKTTNYNFDYKTDLFKVYDKSGKKLLLTVYKGNFDYPYEFFVNDKYVYFAKNMKDKTSSLIQIELNTKKTKSIKNFKFWVEIDEIRENRVYYSQVGDIDDVLPIDGLEFRVLNLENLNDTFISVGVGRVIYGKSKMIYGDLRAVVMPITLYSMGYDYKNPVTISKYAMQYELIDGKVYYAEAKPKKYSDGKIYGDINQQTLYVCNDDGTNKKVLTGIIKGHITKITPNEIEFKSESSSKYYRMNLKTKKIVEIKTSFI